MTFAAPVSPSVLTVDRLCVDARTPEGRRRVLDDVTFDLRLGETLCIAGESGSGKSVTSLAIMGLLPKASLQIASGSIALEGRELSRLSNSAMRSANTFGTRFAKPAGGFTERAALRSYLA